MRKILTFTLALCFVLFPALVDSSSASAQAGDASQLIAEVNSLRAAYGLPPYSANNALMSAAQQQSDYQASIGTWTHTGPDGSRPHDRAVAAGYGGGTQVYVSENVAMGIDLGTSRTVNEMWQTAIHLETMISPNYTHIGAGVGQADGWVYYTIVVGYIAGSAGSVPEPAAEQPAPTSEADVEPVTSPVPSAVPIQSIAISSPAQDGSIEHVVQAGQFLENIATAYDIELEELLSLNGLSSQSVIFPGDKLLIKPASESPTDAVRLEATVSEPEPTSMPTATPTERPAAPTATPVPIAMSAPQIPDPTASVAAEASEPAQEQSGKFDYLLYAVVGLAATGTAMILLGSTLKKRA
jgi:uncharacterized protein YkwD/LysM repeat protein